MSEVVLAVVSVLLVSIPLAMAVAYKNNKWFRCMAPIVGQPGFGPAAVAFVLLMVFVVACGIAHFKKVDLSHEWFAHRSLINKTVVVICVLLVGFSWFNPGLFWDSSWMKELSDDRKVLISWPGGARKESPLTELQDKTVRLHRKCAIWWLAFWVLVPPVWFLIEYSFITGAMTCDDFAFKQFKDTQELTRNIWLAWIAGLATWHGLITTPAKI